MANSTNIIGKVVGLQGQAIIKSPDGKQHPLKIGDVVYENDIIVTATGAQVELAFDDGHNHLVRQNETLTLDASVYAPTQVEVANAALLPDTTTQDINKAITGQNSLDQLLGETAAGLGGGDAGEGNSFVRLDRIAENVTPLSYNAVLSEPAVVHQTPPAAHTIEGVLVNSVSAASTIEGGTQEFVVHLSGQGFAPILLNLALQSGSAQVGVDTSTQMVSVDGGVTFVPLNGSVLVPVGVDNVIVRVTTIKDGIIEGTEALSLVASTSNNPHVVSGTGSILDSAVPIASITGPVDVNEASGTVTFTVALN
ncbi:MAG: retention module-containing protein, partial [Burkholderiales bacterium]|nr:retention module-containing protein [Burkholderiales bacterium]